MLLNGNIGPTVSNEAAMTGGLSPSSLHGATDKTVLAVSQTLQDRQTSVCERQNYITDRAVLNEASMASLLLLLILLLLLVIFGYLRSNKHHGKKTRRKSLAGRIDSDWCSVFSCVSQPMFSAGCWMDWRWWTVVKGWGLGDASLGCNCL